MSDEITLAKTDAVIETIKAELAAASPSKRQRIREAIALAALLATRLPILLVGAAAVALVGTTPPPVAEGAVAQPIG